MIRVELYEMARHLAGVAAVEVEAGTLAEVLAAVRRRHPELEPQVIVGDRLAAQWRASIDGGPWIEDPVTVLSPGDVLVLVSALAGG